MISNKKYSMNPIKRFRKRLKKQKGYKKMDALHNSVKQGGFPDTYFSNLVYKNNMVGLGDNSNVGYFKSYTLNDPTNNNASGSYPQGWTILREVYDVFLVHACKIQFTFQNTSATIPCRVCIAPYDPDTANFGTIPGACTLTQYNYIAQSAYAEEIALSAMGGGKDTMDVVVYCSVGKFTGHGDKIRPNEDRFVGNTGGTNSTRAFTQPTNLLRWAYGAITSTGANLGTNQIVVTAKVTYYVQFCERLSAIL